MKTSSSNFMRILFFAFLLPYRRVVSWLGLAEWVSQEWEARFPSVVLAGILMSLYVWSAGFSLNNLYFVLIFATTATVFILVLNRE